jgi:peptidoglycan hydrolase CwlO-like protein
VGDLNRQEQEIKNNIDKANQDKQQNQQNAYKAQNDINNINMQIQALDTKVDGLNNTISETEKKISAKEAEIKVFQQNIDKAEVEIKNEQELFDKRMRAMYKAGNVHGYLNLLISSKNLSDFFNRAQAVVSIANYDNKILKQLNAAKEKLKEDKVALERNKAELLAYKQDNENKLAEVQKSRKQQQQLMTQAKNRQADYISKASESQKAIDNANTQLALIQDQKRKLGPAAKAPATNNPVVLYAYNFLGCPYVWGGIGKPLTKSTISYYKGTSHDLTGMEKHIGEQGFDCSGLMVYVYAHFGIQLGRTTYDQIYEGTPVSRKELKPGDLILFGTYSNPHHVGMYVGEDKFIEAPFSGEVVRISSLDSMDDYLCARRIIK